MLDADAQDLIDLTRRLLDCIAAGDWKTYEELSDPALTAFEPEARGQLVEGLPFHHFYFKLGGTRGPNQTTICSPRVRLMGEAGDVAVVAYIRLNQRQDGEGRPVTDASEETRVWHRRQGKWQQVHFHRSAISR